MDATQPARRRRPTLRDVSVAAGVDLSTASRLLRNHTDGYRADTVARVQQAAHDLGYRPNAQARGLRLQRQHAVAMLVPDLDNFGFTEVLRGTQEVCLERGFTLLISEVRADSTTPRHDPSLLEGRIDGALVAFATVDDPQVDEWLGQLSLPTVLVQRGWPDAAASVVLDEEHNAAVMVEHLVSLGHQSIAHICGSLRTDTAIRRRRGFDHAMAAHRLRIRPKWSADGKFTFAGGRAATLAVMSGRIRPTALAVDCLVSALGTLSALRELDVTVPDDVSVIAIDDHVVAGQTTPPLTTVRLPQRRLGRRAATMLLDVIDGHAGEQVVIDSPAEVVIRASTGKPPHRATR